MRKLLGIKDPDEFWRIFTEEREKERQKLARLPFLKKFELAQQMNEWDELWKEAREGGRNERG